MADQPPFARCPICNEKLPDSPPGKTLKCLRCGQTIVDPSQPPKPPPKGPVNTFLGAVLPDNLPNLSPDRTPKEITVALAIWVPVCLWTLLHLADMFVSCHSHDVS